MYLINLFDFLILGFADLNLKCMPKPAKTSRNCKLTQLPEFNANAKTVNLFEAKKLNGFWPVYQMTEGNPELMVSTIGVHSMFLFTNFSKISFYCYASVCLH